MKRLFIAGFVVISILLSPLASISFDAQAGRTQSGFGGVECQCGLPAPPICYDEVTGQRCDTSVGSNLIAAPDDNGGDTKSSDTPVDYSSGILLLFVAAFLTSRAIRFP